MTAPGDRQPPGDRPGTGERAPEPAGAPSDERPPAAEPGAEASGSWSMPDAAARVLKPLRSLVNMVVGEDPPLELDLIGRLVLQAVLIGVTVGLAGWLFVVGVEEVESFLLDRLAGYPRLVPRGEHEAATGGLRLWLVPLFPAAGALLAGWLARWAPEINGGGGDAVIAAFHHQGGAIRRRVMLLKPLASIATLSTGGAGGREGPTMLLGGAVGTWVAQLLPTSARERRVLMLAGVAAGISAVFRTPLGAALLAIEAMYRDDFEAEALIPAVLASVVAYSLASTLESGAPLFGALPAFELRWQHLPVYAVAAIVVAAAATLFVAALRGVEHAVARLPGPTWIRPGIGGLGLGLLAVAVVLVARAVDTAPEHVAVLGGGYGNAQLAITGAPGLIGGTAAAVLLAAAVLRVAGSALTLGSGGSAGDFAPSIAIGALVGGALGQAASAWLDVGGLTPGAFALVGMAAFYGGVAKAPLAATVMVCEMAGSYDLLVPLMLVQAIAFVALRRVSLYPAQLTSQRHSPAHAGAWARHFMATVRVGDVVSGGVPTTLRLSDDADRVLRVLADSPDQQVFPVLDDAGTLRGLVTGHGTREIAAADEAPWAIAADLMVPPVSVPATAPLLDVADLMLRHDLRAVPVVDGNRVVGLVDQHELSRIALGEGGSRR